jgi:hypothetical protein
MAFTRSSILEAWLICECTFLSRFPRTGNLVGHQYHGLGCHWYGTGAVYFHLPPSLGMPDLLPLTTILMSSHGNTCMS